MELQIYENAQFGTVRTTTIDGEIMFVGKDVADILGYTNAPKAIKDDVTVRPLSDGGFQYVSNYIVSEEENNNITWHTPRLTEDEWNDIYGEQ